MVTLKFWFTGDEDFLETDFEPLKDDRFRDKWTVGTKENVCEWLYDLLEDCENNEWNFITFTASDKHEIVIDLRKLVVLAVCYPEDA